MLNHTLEQMTELRLHGMKKALIEQNGTTGSVFGQVF